MRQTRTAQPFAVEVGAFQFSRIRDEAEHKPAAQPNAMLMNLGAVQHLLQEQSIYCAPPVVSADGVWLSVAGGSRSASADAQSSRTLLASLHGLLDAFPVGGDVAGRHSALPVRALHARKTSAKRHMDKLTPEAFPSVASLHVSDGQICAVHCGDARIWRLRQTDAEQVEVKLLTSAKKNASDRELDVVQIDLRSCDDTWVHANYADVREGDVYLLSLAGIHDVHAGMDLAQLWNPAESLHCNLHTLECVWRSWGMDEQISVVALKCHGSDAVSDSSSLRRAMGEEVGRLQDLIRSSTDCVSISWIQRRMRVGYLHARELLEHLFLEGTLVRHWKEDEEEGAGARLFCATRPGGQPKPGQIWLRPQTWLNA